MSNLPPLNQGQQRPGLQPLQPLQTLQPLQALQPLQPLQRQGM